MANEAAKLQAARQALELIEDGMVVGLGSGSTATPFIRLLGERVQAGMRVRGIASSRASETLAREVGIPVIGFEDSLTIDVAVDGADEVGPGLALIKGGGGALLREKIVASAAKKFVVVADASKVVERLGKFPLPVEVIRMAVPLVTARIGEMGIESRVRHTADGAVYGTDEGNVILDCACGAIEDPEQMAAEIRSIVGVVEHGLFLGYADLALIADGTEVRELRG